MVAVEKAIDLQDRDGSWVVVKTFDSTVVVAFDFNTGEVAFTVENTLVRVINVIRNEIRIIVDF